MQCDAHLLTVLRYVERDPVGAGLVDSAEHWRWSGLWGRLHGDEAISSVLSPWPVVRPRDWLDLVNAALGTKDLRGVRASLNRGRPFGSDDWVKRTVLELKLEYTIRPEGRPARLSKEG